MTGALHILRTAVGIESLPQLYELQRHFEHATPSGHKSVVMTTRKRPSRCAELLDGGSVYWIIRHRVLCRQAILHMEDRDEPGETPATIIYLSPQIIKVQPRNKRAIQGWRYLQGWDRPKDIGPYDPKSRDDDLPDDIARAIHDIGVI